MGDIGVISEGLALYKGYIGLFQGVLAFYSVIWGLHRAIWDYIGL